jgi:hypothetical protein
MNKFFNHLSFNIVTLSLFASITTQCMLIKKPCNLRLLTLVPNNTNTIKRTYQFNPKDHEGLKVAIALFADGKTQYEALQIFRALIDKTSEGTRFTSPKIIVENLQAYEPAIQAAIIGSTNNDYRVQCEALLIFCALVERGHAFKSATDAAAFGMKSEHSSVNNAALGLFKALFIKKQAFETAALTAAADMTSNDNRILSNARSLFCALFDAGQGFEVATKAAEEAFLNKNINTKCSAITLLKRLVERNHAFEVAMKVAIIGMKDKDQVSNAAGILFEYMLDLANKIHETKS